MPNQIIFAKTARLDKIFHFLNGNPAALLVSDFDE
jgi:hypothetical protein